MIGFLSTIEPRISRMRETFNEKKRSEEGNEEIESKRKIQMRDRGIK